MARGVAKAIMFGVARVSWRRVLATASYYYGDLSHGFTIL